MSDPNNDNHDSFAVDLVYDAVVTDSNSKMVRSSFELLAARRKRIFAERDNFLGYAPLKLFVEASDFLSGGCREF